MSEPFLGEIKIFAGNFAPRGFALCDGQLLAVSQNDALFSLLGTIYGGDGRTTFGLPDLRGRVPLHTGTGPGLTNRRIGSKGGEEQVALTASHLPAHNHTFISSNEAADSRSPRDRVPASAIEPGYAGPGTNTAMNSASLAASGGGQAHANVMPYQCINFIIALVGVYPSSF